MTYYFKFDRLEYIEEYVFDNYVKVLISNYISIHRLPVRLVAGFKSVYAIEFNEIEFNAMDNRIAFISKDGNHLLVSFTRDLSNLINKINRRIYIGIKPNDVKDYYDEDLISFQGIDKNFIIENKYQFDEYPEYIFYVILLDSVYNKNLLEEIEKSVLNKHVSITATSRNCGFSVRAFASIDSSTVFDYLRRKQVCTNNEGEKRMTYYFKFDHYEDIENFVVYSVFLNSKAVKVDKIDDSYIARNEIKKDFNDNAVIVKKVENFKSIYQIDIPEFQTHFVKEMTIESFNSNKKITFKLYRSLDDLFNDYSEIYIGIRRSENIPKRSNETNTTFINFILPDNYETIVEKWSTFVNPKDNLEYVFYEVLLKDDRPEINEVLKNESIRKSIFINYCGNYGYACSSKIGFMAFNKGVLISEMNKYYTNNNVTIKTINDYGDLVCCKNANAATNCTSITQNFGESFKMSQELLNWFKDVNSRNTKKHDDSVDAMRYALNNKKETTMTLKNISFVKNVKFNGPATIVFWNDGTKTVVKCKDESYDTEKGLAMVLAKGYTKKNAGLLMRNIHIFNEGIEVVWANGTTTEMPWKDETHDIEKHLALAKIKKYGALVRGVKNTNWYDQFKALYKHFYLSHKIEEVVKKEIDDKFDSKPIVSPDVSNLNKYVNGTIDQINSDYVIQMFNAGASIKRISKETGLTEYFVKKFIDAATNPDVSKNKAARILNKAAKAAAKEKKPRDGHREKTIITCPKYLDEETGKRILEETKVKYAGRYKYDSDLNMYYIRECKLEYIKTHYNNGYSVYDIAKVLGVSASGVMRIWNEYQRSINKGEE